MTRSILDDYPEECAALIRAAFLAGAEAKAMEYWAAFVWLVAFDWKMNGSSQNHPATAR